MDRWRKREVGKRATVRSESKSVQKARRMKKEPLTYLMMLHLLRMKWLLLPFLGVVPSVAGGVMVLRLVDLLEDEYLRCVCGLLGPDDRNGPILRPRDVIVALRHRNTGTADLLNLCEALPSPPEDGPDQMVWHRKLSWKKANQRAGTL